MHKLTHKLKELGGKRIAFSLTILAYLGFLGFINLMMFIPGNWMSNMGHFNFLSTGETHDVIHELTFALIVGTAALGLLTQLWKPKENFTGQLVALSAWGVMILTAVITNNWVPQPLFIIFGGLTILATILHPAGRGLFSWFRTARVNRKLLALVIIAAVPLLSFAVTNINLQRAGADMNQSENGESFNLFGHKIPQHGGSENETAPTDIEAVKQKYANHTVAQAEREGYVLDQFCLNAESFGQSAELGAMGYHATNESLLRGPIAVERPQALMFNADGKVLGVEYEVMTDAVSEPPQLFGQTFKKLPPHPGVAHEHYALHVWFVDNPNGQLADFNPSVSCPSGSMPSMNSSDMTMDGEVGHDDQRHRNLGHYRGLAALSLIIVLLGILVSFRPSGWRLAAWIAGLLPATLGIVSLVLPSAESSLGTFWSIAAITWGVVFITMAEFIRHKELKEPLEL